MRNHTLPNPTIPVRWILALLLLLIQPAHAQNAQPQPITPGETLTVTLEPGIPALFAYTSDAESTIAITARALEQPGDFPLDTVIIVRDSDDSRIAYNDNHGTGRTDLAPEDSLIPALTLPPGDYTIVIDTFHGIIGGAVEVTLSAIDPFDTTIETADEAIAITGTLPPRTPYTYTFEAAAGDTLTLTGRDASGTLDPRLALLAPSGDLLAENDDHASADLTLNVLDARISAVTIPENGTYTVMLLDFLGRPGDFALTIAWD
jgi:hypothetical protein